MDAIDRSTVVKSLYDLQKLGWVPPRRWSEDDSIEKLRYYVQLGQQTIQNQEMVHCRQQLISVIQLAAHEVFTKLVQSMDKSNNYDPKMLSGLVMMKGMSVIDHEILEKMFSQHDDAEMAAVFHFMQSDNGQQSDAPMDVEEEN